MMLNDRLIPRAQIISPLPLDSFFRFAFCDIMMMVV